MGDERSTRGLGRTIHVLVVAAVLTSACTVGAVTGDPGLGAAPAATPDRPARQVITDVGVTEEPCPGEHANPDNGCIHLGAIVDRSGPHSAMGEAALAGAQAFWKAVNERGGIFGAPHDGRPARYDVDLTSHVMNNHGEVDPHLAAVEELQEEVLALGLSQGTTANVEALKTYKEHDLVTVPLDWWSGWPFEPVVADTGLPYCLQALNGLDYTLELLGGETPIEHVVVAHTPDRHGEDVVAGVERWVEIHRVPFLRSEHAVAVTPDGGVPEAVELIEEVAPEVVVVAAPPDQVTELAGDLAERGWDGWMVGTAPTFVPRNVEDEAVRTFLSQQFIRIDPYPPLDHQAKAYEEMRKHLDGESPPNHFWIAGWMNQYPLHSAIEDALVTGDLTRAGLVQSVEEVTVLYEEGLRRRRYLGDVSRQTPRHAYVYAPDPGADLGERLLAGEYVGRTAADFPVTRPCSEQ